MNPELISEIGPKIVAYKLTLEECSGWMYAGKSPCEVAATIKNEIESCAGLSPEDISAFRIEAYLTTQDEIDSLGEFPGW